ncbi:hypothetical protein Tdes44962_MAKER06055 [Teratosphaeria destructans]|uniref:Apple domain-containing protein n=1 Tax=Teratosphaeria destructans TaxID=418781 RepID=A0A9W7VXU3_9PEZI|nr:hypothetical protein Tdes44962_MAKER06055 [Teratosphaeria destructans]
MTYQAPPGAGGRTFIIYCNFEGVGGDLSQFTATGFDPLQNCADTCSNTAGCVSAGFDVTGSNICYMKSQANPMTSDGTRDTIRLPGY